VAGVEPTRENGMHALRHFNASVLLDAGESIRALAEYLGHADPGFTLRVYTHLMPSSEDRGASGHRPGPGRRCRGLFADCNARRALKQLVKRLMHLYYDI
jgi:hypothetical protein